MAAPEIDGIKPKSALGRAGNFLSAKLTRAADAVRESTGKSLKQTVARVGLSALALGSMVGCGAKQQETLPQEKPAITETVDIGLSAVFSNKDDEGVISKRNTIARPLNEMSKKIVEDKENFIATLPFFPFQPPEGTEIEYLKKTFNPSTVSPTEGLYSGCWWQDAIINRLELSLPRGTKIYAPIDANFYLTKSLFTGPEYPVDFIRLYHYDDATNTTYEIFMFGEFYPTTPLTQNSIKPIEMPENWQEDLSKTKLGDLLLETRKDNARVRMGIRASTGKSLKAEQTLLKKNLYEFSPEFRTMDGKLVMLANQA